MSNRARRQAINQMNVNAPDELTSIIAPMSSIGADTQAAQTAAQRLASTSRPPLVTALPSPALDGQEVLYLASNSGPIWHFRNRLTNPDGTANTSPYKWDFVGGTSLYDVISGAAQRATANNTWDNISTGNPTQVTAPLIGQYEVTAGATGQEVDGTAIAGDVYAAVFGNGVQWTNIWDMWSRPTGAFHKWTLSSVFSITTASVNTTLATKVYVSSASWNSLAWYTGFIQVRPIRVS